jgi:subtilisin family serine protease
MSRRILLVAIVASLASISYSHAQNTQSKSDRLKKLLDEKFIPPPSQTKTPPTVDKKDFHWIAPKTAPVPGRQGRLPPARDLSSAFDLVANNATPRISLQRLTDSRSTGGSATVRTDVAESVLLNVHPQLPTVSRHLQIAQAPAARRNSYIIQLKPNFTEQQLNALLAKYNLTITSGRSSYLLLRVVRNVAVAGSGDAEKLSDILNQQIIRDLRREPIVATATVDTTVTRPSVPQSSNTKVERDGTVYNWSWKNNPTIALGTAGLTASVLTTRLDGNWGLKAIRLPPVWTIIARYREAKPNLVRPKLAIIDTGFAKHEDLAINLLGSPNDIGAVPVASSLSANCVTAHGNHVAGIAGAVHGNGIGIDGVIPQAKIDAVPWSDVLIKNDDPGATSEDTRTTYFSEALFAIVSYVERSARSDLRVVNVSLGYNFGARPVTEGDPEKIAGLNDTIEAQAVMFASLAKKHENRILFVSAAGNDSRGRAAPYDAKWSSPIVWAAMQLPPSRRPKNILIVEANDRDGQRWEDSNIGGHVAAPGVDILSTLWPGDNAYGACPGTSMASPHVSGLATLLFELDPSKKPAEIADIIKTSAIKPSKAPGAPVVLGAPRLDALEAVLKLSPDNLTRLADLNRDGKVDIDDLKILAKQMAALADNRANGTAFTEDLNGDGVVDGNECNWPLIDLNGSGTASLALTDAKLVQGMYRTDLDVMALAWTDKIKDFKTALSETGLDKALQAADTAPQNVSAQGCQ